MTNLCITAFEGQLAAAPEAVQTTTGTWVATATVYINHRRRDADGNWIDAEPTRRYIKAWRTSAQKLATLTTGATVVVIGNVETETWTDKETGEKRTRDVVIVDSLGQGLILPRTDTGEHINLNRHDR